MSKAVPKGFPPKGRPTATGERAVKGTRMRFRVLELAEAIRTFFAAPVLPPTALALRPREIALLEGRRRRGRVLVRRAAVEPVPEGALEPSFDGKNVRAREALRHALERALEKTGLRRAQRWAVALPSATCRLFLLEVEHVPKAREELAAVIGWKIERLVGVSATELTIAVQHLPSRWERTTAKTLPAVREAAPRSERFLTLVARSEVLANYEELFREVGLYPGFLVSNNLAESGWMATLPPGQDALLISIEGDWMTLFFTRNREPLAVRAFACEPESLLDEIHRTLVYYQDRLSPHRVELRSVENTSSEAPASPSPSEELRDSVGVGLHTIVVINHNESSEGASSPFVRELEALCRTLFPPDAVPTCYTLNEHSLEEAAKWRLSHFAAPLGLILSS